MQREKTFAFVILYICLEVIILSLHFILMKLGIDVLFQFFDDSVVVLTLLGVMLLIYLLTVMKKLDSTVFRRAIALTSLGIIFPVIFVLFMLSQLH